MNACSVELGATAQMYASMSSRHVQSDSFVSQSLCIVLRSYLNAQRATSAPQGLLASTVKTCSQKGICRDALMATIVQKERCRQCTSMGTSPPLKCVKTVSSAVRQKSLTTYPICPDQPRNMETSSVRRGPTVKVE